MVMTRAFSNRLALFAVAPITSNTVQNPFLALRAEVSVAAVTITHLVAVVTEGVLTAITVHWNLVATLVCPSRALGAGNLVPAGIKSFSAIPIKTEPCTVAGRAENCPASFVLAGSRITTTPAFRRLGST